MLWLFFIWSCTRIKQCQRRCLFCCCSWYHLFIPVSPFKNITCSTNVQDLPTVCNLYKMKHAYLLPMPQQAKFYFLKRTMPCCHAKAKIAQVAPTANDTVILPNILTPILCTKWNPISCPKFVISVPMQHGKKMPFWSNYHRATTWLACVALRRCRVNQGIIGTRMRNFASRAQRVPFPAVGTVQPVKLAYQAHGAMI